MFDEAALCIQMPVVIKARADGDRRMVEVEASNQVVDSEGDVILQRALLDSADRFVKTGHLDIDHISEIGDRLGIPNPTDFIVGVPTEVKDLGDGRTGVVGELHKKGRAKADELWDSLKAEPPVRWQASIYGFPVPGAVVDARVAKAEDLMGATRFLVKSLEWRSLAFTRNPVNTAIKGAARVVTAKSFLAFMKSKVPALLGDLSKADEIPVGAPIDYILPPRNREELMGHYYYHIQKGRCPFAGGPMGNSVYNFRTHFSGCCCEPEWEADIKALALMHLLKREKQG
jgi:hypothetical protein